MKSRADKKSKFNSEIENASNEEQNDSSALQFAAEEILAALPVSEQGPFNRSKIMLIGQGEAGKTATSRSILGLPQLKVSENKSTVGVDQLTCSLTFANIHSKGVWSESDAENKDYELSIAQMLYEKAKRKEQQQSPSQHIDDNVHEKMYTSSTSKDEEVNQENELQLRKDDKRKENSILKSVDFDSGMVNKCLAERVSLDSCLRISLFDFGGQRIFSSIHHLFLTKYGVYLVVFNMKWIVGSEEEKSECLEYLDFWINSVAMHTSDIQKQVYAAPIAIVGTHADIVTDVNEYKRISDEINDKFQKVSASIIRNEDLAFFPIDNGKGHLISGK